MSDCGCSTQMAQPMKRFEEALDLLLSQARPVSETERVACARGLGRVLAEPLVSRIDVPSWDNSAMDGYAINTADLTDGRSSLKIGQRIAAGYAGAPLEPGTAARIFTGAPVPPNADAVVIQEVCERQGERVLIREAVKSGANIRRAGEDIETGAEILSAGVRLRPQHLALAASVGIDQLPVYRRLRVALFCSGDELVMPGQPLGPGQIYNSNQFSLAALVQALGCEVISLGIVEDSFEATCDALTRGAAESDLVLASGGVSVGEEDHVKPAVERLGSLDLWKIAIRPGKPLAFGHIQGTPFIGSPGNPVSLFVTFSLFARPFILRTQGVTGDLVPVPLRVPVDFDWPHAGKRREFARARLERDGQGQAKVSVYPSRSSGVLSSVVWANGLAVIPENRVLHRGDLVDFFPFSELL